MSLLQKVIDTAGADEDLRAGYLTDELQDRFCEGTRAVPGTVQVYREFKPLWDAVEYTVLFKADVSPGWDGSEIVKLRTDFDLTMKEIESFGGEQATVEAALLMSRAFARAKIRHTMWNRSNG